MSDIKERLREHNDERLYQEADELMYEAANHIERQEALISKLHTSIAGAVQHGEQGWQRHESANKMCLNQQAEIAGLNQVIAELRKDENMLRILLARQVGGALLYSDDGELQDNSAYPYIDFKNDSPNKIASKMVERTLKIMRSLSDTSTQEMV